MQSAKPPELTTRRASDTDPYCGRSGAMPPTVPRTPDIYTCDLHELREAGRAERLRQAQAVGDAWPEQERPPDWRWRGEVIHLIVAGATPQDFAYAIERAPAADEPGPPWNRMISIVWSILRRRWDADWAEGA